MHALLTFAIILLHASVTRACHSFKDTNVTVVSETGGKYHSIITGCLERKEFEGTTVAEIYIEKQQVSKLEKDAIRHLHNLEVLSVKECPIETVEPALFRNVPLLKEVRMVRNKLKKVPIRVFSNLERLEILDLRGNEINTVENGAFGNSSTLKDVNLGFNKLEAWSGDWFGNSTNLRVMDYQHNLIKVVPRRAFYKFPKLQKICFDYNELETIHPEAFAGLTHLRFLGLRYNRLTTLNARIFSNHITIDKIMLDANYLNFLPTRLLAYLEVKEVSLAGNPWKCPCLDQIHNWLFQTNGTVKKLDSCERKDLPVCSYASSFQHTCRETIDDEVTASYFEKLRLLEPPLNQYCARLDRLT